MKHIILASASPRRKEILELADLKFDVMPSDAQEITTKTAPNEVVMELASIKAKDIYKKSEKQSMVLGADTVVAYQGQILGKPADEADAKRMLTMLSGQTHEVYTGVCVIEDGKTKTFYAGWSQEKRDLFCRDYSRACLSHDRRTDPGLCGKWRTYG